MKRPRALLAKLFIGAFLIDLVLVVSVMLMNGLSSSERNDLLLDLLWVYLPPISVMVTGFAATASKGGQPPRGALTIAVGVCVIWNLFIMIPLGHFALKAYQGDIGVAVLSSSPLQELRDYLDKVTKAGSTLVAGTLAYYFASNTLLAKRGSRQ